MYKILKAILFLFDPEKVHHFSMKALKQLCNIGFIRKWIMAGYAAPVNLPFFILDNQFSNKVGLGAGFDKNAKYLRELATLGFGFVEVGTVTPLPQSGSEKPRLFRLPKDRALINRMGFNNEGAEVISGRLRLWKSGDGNSKNNDNFSRLIIGGNIGKNKATTNELAWKDYETCFLALHDLVHYFVVNVSSPNTPGLRELQEKESLAKILKNLQALNAQKEKPKPILLKIAPDLNLNQVDDVIALAMEINLDGLVVSNTTINRSGLFTSANELEKIGAGGLSGTPVKKRSTELIRYISTKTNNKLLIIGSGGIFNAEDAVEKIKAGASLVQVWTGFIYEGPSIVKKICKGL